MNSYREKYNLLQKKLKEKNRIAIAFSGGIDSALLSYAAKQADIDAILITVTSPLFSKFDERIAMKTASYLGFKHIIVTHKLDTEVVNNPFNRCYYCKKDEAKTWKRIATEQGYLIVADGCNYEDVQDEHRPGILACDEQGIWHPLAEANITKIEIRKIAKEMGISTWDRPSNACLASRIKYGEVITIQKLQMIERAEEFIRKISPQVRVRLHQDIARIEVPTSHLKDMLRMREKIITFMRKIGFVYITLDLVGYRSGSMNENIAKTND
jgi:uncharacterized protein